MSRVRVCVVSVGLFLLVQSESGFPQSLEEEMVEAARSGLAADVRHYIELGARIDARVFLDKACIARTALIEAIRSNREEVVLVLLEQGADPESAGSDGMTPLLTAAGSGRENIVRYLLEAGAEPDRRVQLAAGELQTALAAAAGAGDVESLRLLLSVGANPNVDLGMGVTPLMQVARWGRTEVVRELLRGNAAVDAVDARGATALLPAVESNRSSMVELLLAAGADPDAKGAPVTPLMSAAARGATDLVRLLLRAGAAVNEKRWMGKTALMRAVAEDRSSDRVETVKVLVDAGAALNLLDDSDLTALDWAIACGSDEMVGYLRRVGARTSGELLASGRK